MCLLRRELAAAPMKPRGMARGGARCSPRSGTLGCHMPVGLREQAVLKRGSVRGRRSLGFLRAWLSPTGGGSGRVDQAKRCPAPDLMEALNPLEDESHGDTEEVP